MTCGRTGCKKTAKFYPKILLVPMEDKQVHRVAGFVMEIPICHGHKREITTDMLLPPEQWGAICKAFMSTGKPVPDRNRIGLGFVKIEGYERQLPDTPGVIIEDYEETTK